MKFHIFLTAILIAYNLFFSATATPKERLSDYVNPFIGASTNEGSGRTFISTGKTFPGATVPWGMTQVSPNTITGGDNGSGYSDEHRTIEGFALTQMSGVGWYGDLGNFLVMPTTGALHTYRGTEENPDSGYRSRYDKESEKASAGYYSVHLTDYDITTELTATPHCGIMRFTFPENEHSRIQIDLNSIAKGYSVDLIADYLKKKGINRFVVEVGGEIVASGRREEGALWRIGIDKPKEGNFFPGKFLQEVLLLEDAAMATSGNYRQFYLIEGKERVNHIINPKTGQNSKNTMLSATVIAPTCAEADAFATLFMVVGIDKSREILSRNPHLGAYLIYAEGDEDRVFITPDVVKRIKK